MSDEYVKDEEIIETRWKCSTCDRDNRGRDMKCPGCGSPKDESSEYEVDAGAAAIEDEQQVADAEAGVHWVCAYCEKENRGRKQICQFCGADQTTRARKQKGQQPPPLPKKKPNLALGCSILAVALIGVFALLVWIGSPRHVDGKVTALAWSQALHLHEKTVAHKEDWQDELPADAFNSACQRRQRTTRQVVDHYRTVTKTRKVKYQSGSREECRTVTENLENGYAKRKKVCKDVPEYDYRNETYTDQDPVYRTEPVFDEFCRFDVYEWPVIETAKREGSGTGGLAWPPADELARLRGECVPCEQAKTDASARQCCSKEAHYRVTFEDAEKPGDKPVYDAKTAEEFATFALGQTHELSISDEKVSLAKDDP